MGRRPQENVDVCCDVSSLSSIPGMQIKGRMGEAWGEANGVLCHVYIVVVNPISYQSSMPVKLCALPS